MSLFWNKGKIFYGVERGDSTITICQVNYQLIEATLLQ